MIIEKDLLDIGCKKVKGSGLFIEINNNKNFTTELWFYNECGRWIISLVQMSPNNNTNTIYLKAKNIDEIKNIYNSLKI